MGTDKRNRQKQNRLARRNEVAQKTQRQILRRRITRIALLLGAVVGVVLLFNLSGGGDESETATSDSVIPAESTVAPAAAGPFAYGEGECAPTDGSGSQVQAFTSAPKLCIDLTKTYTAVVSTSKGDFTVVLDAAKAPGTVNNFVNLARSKYFDDTVCHRVIPSLVVQCGDQLQLVRVGRVIQLPMSCRLPANTNSAHWPWPTRGQTQTAVNFLLFPVSKE